MLMPAYHSYFAITSNHEGRMTIITWIVTWLVSTCLAVRLRDNYESLPSILTKSVLFWYIPLAFELSFERGVYYFLSLLSVLSAPDRRLRNRGRESLFRYRLLVLGSCSYHSRGIALGRRRRFIDSTKNNLPPGTVSPLYSKCLSLALPNWTHWLMSSSI